MVMSMARRNPPAACFARERKTINLGPTSDITGIAMFLCSVHPKLKLPEQAVPGWRRYREVHGPEIHTGIDSPRQLNNLPGEQASKVSSMSSVSPLN